MRVCTRWRGLDDERRLGVVGRLRVERYCPRKPLCRRILEVKSEVPVVNALVAIVKHGAERSSASDGDVGDGEGSVMCGVELAFVDRVLHGGGWSGLQQGVRGWVVSTRCEQTIPGWTSDGGDGEVHRRDRHPPPQTRRAF